MLNERKVDNGRETLLFVFRKSLRLVLHLVEVQIIFSKHFVLCCCYLQVAMQKWLFRRTIKLSLVRYAE